MSGNANHKNKRRVPHHAVNIALMSAILAFGILAIIASNYIVGIQSVIYNQNLVVPPTLLLPETTTSMNGVKNGTKTTVSVPTSAKFKMAALQCKTVCSKLTGVCVPINLAVFVFKNSSTSTLKFDEQLTYPTVRVLERSNNSTAKPSSENCYMEDHYPDFELIPRQGSCAVVGNGGILNNSSCGDIIDSHDFVIRANMATIKGYERDVGNKTNITAINISLLRTYSAAISKAPKSSKSRDIRDRFLEQVRLLRKSILWYPKPLYVKHKNKVIGNAGNYRTIIKAIQSDGSSHLRYGFSWKPIHVEGEWKTGKYGTLGFDLFVVARTFCDNISLFGFYPFYKDPNGTPLKYHYFDDVKYDFNKTNVHNFGREYNILQKLDVEEKLKLVVGSCKS